MKEMWARELKKLGRWQEYKFGIVMPCAQRNLMIIFIQEKLAMSNIRQIFKSLGLSIAHLHIIGGFSHQRHTHTSALPSTNPTPRPPPPPIPPPSNYKPGRIHGDIKPLNVVRAFDESITLIDLDMAVPLGSPVGAKQLSTAFVGPETTNETVDADGGATAEFRKVTRTLSLTLALSAALTLPVALTQGGRLRERCGEDTAQGPGRRQLQRGGQGLAHVVQL